MPQSIRSLIKDLSTHPDYLAGMRTHVDEATCKQIDAELDRVQAEIDSLVEVHT